MTDAPEVPRHHSTSALLIGYTAVILMMGCLVWVVYQALHLVLPQTRFNLLVPFEVFVAIEAMITTHSMVHIEPFSLPWLLHRTVEWIVLLVLVKLLTYASLGFNQLAVDVLRWDDQFASFLTLEFMVGVIVTTLIWILACHFAAQLLRLFGSQENLDLELKGIGLVNRQAIHQGLTSLIFAIGGIMLAIVTAINYFPQILPAQVKSPAIPFQAVMMYFIGGLILLAQANLFSRWSRWYLHGIQSSPNIWLRWLLFSLMMITTATLLANLLPTGYSLGLLGLLQSALQYILFGIAILEFLVITPIIWLLNFLTSLFGTPPFKVQTPTIPPTPAPTPSAVGFSHTPFLDLLRSLLFWTVFFSLVFIAFRVYIRQNKEVVETLRKQPYLKWIFQFWDWLKSLLIRAGSWTQNAVAAGRASLIKSRREIIIHLPQAAPVLEKLPPRQKIRLTYLIMVELIASLGYPRQKQETPDEYARKLVGIYPNSTGDIQELTQLFIAARYSLQQVTPLQAQTALSHWKALQEALQSEASSGINR